MSDAKIAQFDSFIRRDPAQRGLIGSEPRFGPLCPGHIAEAAADIAQFGKSIAIVTGFFIPGGDPPAAETDGPPGALLLAQALRLSGIESVVLTDTYCWSALVAAARASGFPIEHLVCYPPPGGDSNAAKEPEAGRERFLSMNADFTHLIAVERVGPCHTIESLNRQQRKGAAPLEAFEDRVAPDQRDHCHNMRGEMIDLYARDVHRLFEDCGRIFPAVKTIGIGDGGNEIGMGAIPWEDLERRLSGEQSGRIPCRVACDWNIVAGTSNWGAAALAAAVLHLRDHAELLLPFTAQQQRHVLEEMVAHGPAVDGMTGRREATVDGIPFLTYIQPWEGMRRVLGLE